MKLSPTKQDRRRQSWKQSGDREWLRKNPEPPDVPPCGNFYTSGYGDAVFYCNTCYWPREDHPSWGKTDGEWVQIAQSLSLRSPFQLSFRFGVILGSVITGIVSTIVSILIMGRCP